MKAKDLDLTTEYLSNTTRGWEDSTYTGSGHGATRRVRIIEGPGVYRYNTSTGMFAVVPDRSTFRAVKGYLVALLDIETGEPTGKQDVVTAASIRGPWAELWSEIVRRQAVRVETARTEREAREVEHARVLAALEVIEYRTGMSRGATPYGDARAIVHVSVLEAIAALLEDRR